MPNTKRERIEPVQTWAQLRLLLRWPEQVAYELVRSVVLYGETATDRARATGESARTIDRKADRSDRAGMLGLFPHRSTGRAPDARSLPPPMRQLIVGLHAEVPAISRSDIADVCRVRYGRRPSHHTVRAALAAGPPPTVTTRRYPRYSRILDPVVPGSPASVPKPCGRSLGAARRQPLGARKALSRPQEGCLTTLPQRMLRVFGHTGLSERHQKHMAI